MSEASIIAPTREVVVGAETLVIRPFAFSKLPAVAKRLANIALSVQDTETLDIPSLLADGGDDILAVMALAIGKPVSWFDSLHEWDKGIEILSAIVELNREQFVKKLLPAIQQLVRQMTPAEGAASPSKP